jgi:hypothetical protein
MPAARLMIALSFEIFCSLNSFKTGPTTWGRTLKNMKSAAPTAR